MTTKKVTAVAKMFLLVGGEGVEGRGWGWGWVQAKLPLFHFPTYSDSVTVNQHAENEYVQWELISAIKTGFISVAHYSIALLRSDRK